MHISRDGFSASMMPGLISPDRANRNHELPVEVPPPAGAGAKENAYCDWSGRCFTGNPAPVQADEIGALAALACRVWA